VDKRAILPSDLFMARTLAWAREDAEWG